MPVIDIQFLVQTYLEGLTSGMASQRVLGSGVFRMDGDFEPKGATVHVGRVAADEPPADRVYLSGTGLDAQSITDAEEDATVYTVTLSANLTHSKILNLKNNDVIGFESVDDFLAQRFSMQGKKRIVSRAMTNVVAITGATVLDITAEAPNDLVSRDRLLELKGKAGDDDDELLCWFMHSEVVAAVEALVQTNGNPVYSRNDQGDLMVHGYPVIPCDIGTKDTSGTTFYNTILAKRDAVALGVRDPLGAPEALKEQEVAPGIRVIPVVGSVAGGEGGYTFEMDLHYYTHVFNKRPNDDRKGIYLLQHHIP